MKGKYNQSISTENKELYLVNNKESTEQDNIIVGPRYSGSCSYKGGSIDSRVDEQFTASNVSYTNENTGSVEIHNFSQMIKLDDEEAKLVPEEVKTHELSEKEKDQILLNNRMRSKKRSEQMRKRLDKVSGEKFYFKHDCGIENGENQQSQQEPKPQPKHRGKSHTILFLTKHTLL